MTAKKAHHRRPKKRETIEEPAGAVVAAKSTKGHLLWGRVKERIPEISEVLLNALASEYLGSTLTGPPRPVRSEEPKPKAIDKEKRSSEESQKLASSIVERWSSISEKGKTFKRRLTSPNVKPKQKDPLHQWFVDHSGGTLRGA
ncbi:hypothetical protein GGR54DRAFT_618267 [Hypoxylon sp. NC1633]|nr:hypothetical protein GGR54DRAFT_618267 [Hypoxylon sp. NC1633]